MKIISLEQGSDSWLYYRKNRIMATDSSIITGHNPYKDRKTIWKEKLDMLPSQKDNPAMARGRLLEPIARSLFMDQMKFEVFPEVVEHDSLWWMAASLDGIDSTGKRLVEIKCPKLQTHLVSANFEIPYYYLVQIQHQLACTGAEVCYYTSFHPDLEDGLRLIINEIYPKPNFINRMIDLEYEFYEKNLCQMLEPDESLNICPYED